MSRVKVTYPTLTRKQVIERLREAQASLEQKLSVSKIILYGSYAEGRYTAGSDIDVIVIYEGKERDDAYKVVMGEVGLPNLEPKAYTVEWFNALMLQSPPFAENLRKKGIVISWLARELWHGREKQNWLNQAERDLKQAEASLRDGFYEWACFAAQQASEKSVKALIQVLGGEVWGHSVTALIDALPDQVRPYPLRDKALELDQAYIPSRYPNAHPVGFPGSMYSEAMAERLIAYAKEIFNYCQEMVRRVGQERQATES